MSAYADQNKLANRPAATSYTDVITCLPASSAMVGPIIEKSTGKTEIPFTLTYTSDKNKERRCGTCLQATEKYLKLFMQSEL